MSLSAKIITNTISWSDGNTFDGYIVFLTVTPATAQQSGINGEIISELPVFAKSTPTIKAPLVQIIPVRNGVVDSAYKVWRTDAYNPRGCKYKAYLFDASWTQLTGVTGFPTSLFTVTDDYTFSLGAISTSATDGAAILPSSVGRWAVVTGSGTYVSPCPLYVSRQTISVASPNVSYPIQTSGAVLFLRVTEDGTNPVAPVFGAEFSGVDASDVNQSASKTTSMIFVSNGTLWENVGVRSIV